MNRKHLLTLIAAPLLCLAAPAFAQLDHLNVDTLIKGLREQKMSELLIHLSKDMKDEADAKKLQIEMLIMRSQTPAIPIAERKQSFAQAVEQFGQLIAKFRDSDKRPLWQADLGLQLLYAPIDLTELASDFYEFGVPTEEQRKMFESYAQIGAENLLDADVTLAKLVRDLPRVNEKLLTAYLNSGRWEEIKDEYGQTRVPFLKAQTAYLAALLPDAHPYYQNLGKNPNLPLQASTPAAERQRLLKMVADEIAIAPEMIQRYGMPVREFALVRGKAMIRLGRHAEGIQLIDTVVAPPPAENATDLLALRALLAKAVGIDGRDKKPDAAMLFLDSLKDHPRAKGAPFFLMLIADLQHRLLLAAAGKDKKKIEDSYLPYDKLTSDGQRMSPQQLDYIRRVVFTRWADKYGDLKEEQLLELPPMVVSGMADNERLRGQEEVGKAYGIAGQVANAATEAEKAALKDQVTAAFKASEPHLKLAIKLAEMQINSKTAPVEVKARAMYTRAFAKYLQGPEDALNIIESSLLWADVAELAPQHPLAEESIGKAIGFIRSLQAQDVRGKELDDAYARITKILFEKLPDCKAALDNRLHWTFTVLQGAGKFADAIKSFDKIPPDHRDFVEAQREMLFCQRQLWMRMPSGEAKNQMRDQIRTDIDRVMRLSRRGLEEATDPKQIALFKKTLADLVLSGADIDIDRGRWEDAERALQNFAVDFNDPELNSLAMSKLILAKVRQGKSDESIVLVNQLTEAVGTDPEKQAAVASMLDSALESLADDVERLQYEARVAAGDLAKQEKLKAAADRAKASEQLSDRLLRWARTRNVPADQIFRYQLIKIQSLLLNQKKQEALDAIKQLRVDDPAAGKDARVVSMEAESLFLSTTRADLIECAKLLRKITDEPRPDKPTAQMSPKERAEAEVRYQVWWRSWLRFLQILDRLKEHTGVISDRVKQLRLEDEDLGGPAFKPQFELLETTHRNAAK